MRTSCSFVQCHQEALNTPESSPAKAFNRNWVYVGMSHDRRSNDVYETYPAQTEFTDDTASLPTDRTSIFHRRRSCIPSKVVQLQLGLISDLRRKALVASDGKIGAANDFVGFDPLASCGIAHDADVRHRCVA